MGLQLQSFTESDTEETHQNSPEIARIILDITQQVNSFKLNETVNVSRETREVKLFNVPQ